MTTINVHLDSKYGTKANDGVNSNVLFAISPPIVLNRLTHDISCMVQSAEIPISFYLIDSLNNSFHFKVGSTGIQRTFYISQGNYTGDSLATILSSASGLTVQYNSLNMKFDFIHTDVFIIYSNSTCLDLLGLNKTNHTAQIDLNAETTTFKLSSIYVCDLNGTKNLYIYSDLPYYSITAQGRENILLKCPIDVSFGDIYFYNNQSGIKNQLSNISIVDNITIKIVDDKKNPLDFNGMDFSLSITFYITEKLEPIIVSSSDELGIKPHLKNK